MTHVDIRTQENFMYQNSIVDFHFYFKNSFGIHSHDFYEIMLTTEGTILHYLNERSEIIHKQTLLLLRPGETHRSLPFQNERSEHLTISIVKSEFQKLCEIFSATLFHEINHAKQLPTLILSDQEFEYILLLAHKVNLASTENFQAEILKTSKQIILNVLPHFLSFPEYHLTTSDWLDSFLQFISAPENFTKRLSELYAVAPYSQSPLSRYFKQYTGKTIIAYITDKKINYACNLLKSTNHSITYISALLGYESLAHFNRTFKRIMGVTPSAYRNHEN